MPPKIRTHCNDCGKMFGDGVERAYKRGICKECFRIEDRQRYQAEYSNRHNINLGAGGMLEVLSKQALRKRRDMVRRYMICVERQEPIQYKANYLDSNPDSG